MRLIAGLLIASVALMAAQPLPFAVMDMAKARDLQAQEQWFDGKQTRDYFINLPDSMKQGGFLLGEWDYCTYAIRIPHANLQSENPFPMERLSMLMARGDYGMTGFWLYTYAKQTQLTMTTTDLTNGNGGRIGAENVMLLRPGKLPKYKTTEFLFPPDLKQVSEKSLLGFLILVNAPQQSKPGVYRGTVTVSTAECQRKIELVVRVPEVTLPEVDIPIGNYMPFYAFDQGGKEGRWAMPDYTSARQDHYFRFLVTRNMNSPTLYHVAPEFEQLGKLKMTFKTVDALVQKIVRAGGCKALLFDIRMYGRMADRLAKLKKFKEAGMDAAAIYKNLVKQFCDHAKAMDYPRFYVMAEEEISLETGYKRRCFDRFEGHMREVAGVDNSIIVDNSIGWDRPRPQDLGHLRGYRYRQYNSWTEQGLKQAEKDGAEVWSYNFFYRRPSFGLILHRLNSRGHHQWADTWASNWSISMLTDQGVVSSLQYEMAHEGINDYRWLMALKKKNPEVHRSMMKGIAVKNRDFNSDETLTKERLDLIRWKACLELTGQTMADWTSAGTPELRLTESDDHAKVSREDMVLRALRQPDDYDMERDLDHWPYHGLRYSTGYLRYMLSKERHLRAYCSSRKEFEERNTPSCCVAWVSYNNQGLFLKVRQNHVKFGQGKRGNDDPGLWQDSCVEFFFRPRKDQVYQLIVSSSNARTLLKNGKVIDATGIKVVGRPKLDKAGGCVQAVMVPWQNLGLTAMPKRGESWTCNVGREFHQWKQYTSWARVNNGFREMEHWGTLIFSGEKNRSLLQKVGNLSLYPGRNTISGTLAGKEPLTVTLLAPNGTRIAEQRVADTSRAFAFQVRLLSIESLENYALVVTNAQGKVLEREDVPVIPAREAVTFKRQQAECLSGGILELRTELNVASREFQDGFRVRLGGGTASYRQEFSVKPKGHRFTLWLKTAGLPPGDYTLEPVFSPETGKLYRESGKASFRIYPAAW